MRAAVWKASLTEVAEPSVPSITDGRSGDPREQAGGSSGSFANGPYPRGGEAIACCSAGARLGRADLMGGGPPDAAAGGGSSTVAAAFAQDLLALGRHLPVLFLVSWP